MKKISGNHAIGQLKMDSRLTLKCMNSFLHLLSRFNLIGVALIGNFFDDPFLIHGKILTLRRT